MKAPQNCMSIAAYIASEACNAAPDRALEMLKALNDRLLSKGLTLEGIVEDALHPQRALARMPDDVMSKKNWRAWVSYMFARRDELPEKDERHLRVCFTQIGWLKSWQMRWIYDILARMEPAGCGTWGAPE